MNMAYSGLGLLVALLLALFTPLFYRFRRRQKTPYLYYSQVGDLTSSDQEQPHHRWAHLPDKLFMALSSSLP